MFLPLVNVRKKTLVYDFYLEYFAHKKIQINMRTTCESLSLQRFAWMAGTHFSSAEVY